MPSLRTLLLAAAVLASGCAPTSRWSEPVPPAAPLDAARLADDVAWLADDEREGRGLGTAGLEQAAAYLARGFEEAGFAPGADAGSFLQRFEMPVSIRVTEARLEVADTPLARGRDFDALFASEDGELQLPVAFAGYGISDEASGYDDYADLDVAGHAVLVLDARPAGEQSPVGGGRGAAFLSRAYKLLNARRHGAAALLIAPSVGEVPGLPANAGAESPTPTVGSAGILAFGVSRETALSLLERDDGPGLEAVQAAIDATGQPASRRLAGTRIEAVVRIERSTGVVANVVAVLPGADPALAHEAVVVGAHYDHLGVGAFGSLAPSRRGEVHNGADDNASGAAGLLALARAFAAGPSPRRSLVLVAFTGEEAGLVGSAEYVRSPAFPIQDTVAMLNLDMIGRLRDGQLTVFGAESAARLGSLVEQAAEPLPLTLSFAPGAAGPSDQTSFQAARVPVLMFFTGTHAEYHTPDDDAEGVDAEGEARVLELVQRVTRALLDAEDRPRFARATATPAAGGGSGYGPYLGTVPAFGGAPATGVLLQGVSPGSPAERAGLRGGDVIVGFGGAPVRNLEEYAALLFASRAGDRVEIVVERDGARLTTHATLGQRR